MVVAKAVSQGERFGHNVAVKGFTRYYREPAFRAEVDAQFALAASASRPGIWITYAIHDPTRADDIDHRAEGLIVYVGQSKQFATRVRDRMTSAGRAVKRPTDRIDGLLYDIMSRGAAPRWSILEEVESALDSLVSETNWATRLRTKGYPLVNQWSEHRLGTLEVSRNDVDPKRLWPMTASDAIGSKVDVVIRDLATGEEVVVDLNLMPPNTRLQKIKAHAIANGRRARLIIR
ncbi:hypothetical protein [Sphingobium sp. B8D3C]|nr:hypothetical protein [Sphingobium sp. B8D3C]MCW2393761.1 hypothetical protein [Sphingobium sp. B8D3B]MCW2417274.1 hypothetical protein [Sphingobium sp. B8D3C]